MATSPRRVLLPLGLGTALSQVGAATLYIILPTHTEDAGISLAAVGVLFSASRFMQLIFDGPVGLTVDRWPRRPLYAAALVAGVVSTLLPALAQGFGPLLVSRLLWGMAWACIWIGGSTFILDVTGAEDRGRWTGRYQAFYSAGLVLAMVTGGILTDSLGYQGALLVCAAVGVVGMLPALWLPDTRSGRAAARSESARHAAGIGAGLREVWATFRTAGRGLWLACALQAVNECITMGVIAGTLALLVQALLPGTGWAVGMATATGVAAALRLILAAVVALAAGLVSDRLHRSGVTARWRLALLMLSIGVVSLVMMASTDVGLALAGLLVGALAGSGLRVYLAALVGDLVTPGQCGRAMGLLTFCGDVGAVVGPVVAYALLPRTGLPGVYLGCAGLYALGLAATLWLLARQRIGVLVPHP
jgi:MFS family permease